MVFGLKLERSMAWSIGKRRVVCLLPLLVLELKLSWSVGAWNQHRKSSYYQRAPRPRSFGLVH